jgi:hypothetical protein
MKWALVYVAFLLTEHKEVGSCSGAGSAEGGTGGGPASTGSGESLQAPFDWTVAFSCWSQGVFQQAAELYAPGGIRDPAS